MLCPSDGRLMVDLHMSLVFSCVCKHFFWGLCHFLMLFDFESLKLKAPDLFTDRQRERARYERMTGDVHRYYCLNSSSVI